MIYLQYVSIIAGVVFGIISRINGKLANENAEDIKNLRNKFFMYLFRFFSVLAEIGFGIFMIISMDTFMGSKIFLFSFAIEVISDDKNIMESVERHFFIAVITYIWSIVELFEFINA